MDDVLHLKLEVEFNKKRQDQLADLRFEMAVHGLPATVYDAVRFLLLDGLEKRNLTASWRGIFSLN